MKTIFQRILQTTLFKIMFSNNWLLKFISKHLLKNIGLIDPEKKDPFHHLSYPEEQKS
jgi:hypothetical protein